MSRRPKFTMDIEGIDDMQEVLRKLAPNHATNLMRSVTLAIASDIRNEAKRNVPDRTGNLKKAIKSKRDKVRNKYKPTASVYVTKGKTEKNNAFHWHFVEYGTKDGTKEHAFFRRAIDTVSADIDSIMRTQFKAKLKAMIAREQKRRAKK